MELYRKSGENMKAWVLVANSSVAKIFASDKLRTGELKVVGEFDHPESRKKVSELMTDKPGHYKAESGAYGSFSKSEPKLVEADHFALQLLHELKAGWDKHNFEKLIIVTPGHFHGILKKHLHHYFKHLEINHIDKDYTKYTVTELHTSLKEHLFPF
jgi:protein required for attachment to host cells